MITELSRVIDSVVKDKGVNKDEIIQAVEDAVLSAAEKLFRMNDKFNELEVHYNEENGEVELFEFKEVVDDLFDPDVEIVLNEANELDPEAEIGDLIGVKISPEFSRIAIQNAKQKVLQKLKEAEGKVIFGEFIDRKGDLVGGIVRRVERRNVIVDIGRTEAILPKEEQVPREYYKAKERIRAILLDIVESKKGPQLILSRASNEFVRKLFETEVPEITEQVVSIKAISRDAGSRTKISVDSKDPDVDPVGACVGMRGARVQNIIQELRGEKIDIVPWSNDTARFTCNALSPAKVNKVIIDENNKAMEVIVDDDQLSLAIGRKGQNVRLASQLTEWKIDIKTETQVKKEQQEVISILMSLPKLGEVTANLLYSEGYRSLEDIAFADSEVLSKTAGVEDLGDVENIQTAARIALRDKLEKMTVEEAIEETGGNAEVAEKNENETDEKTIEENNK
ncbi:MAG: transcription termination factor NusA [Thermodesulfobacteriota bacterium]